MKRFNHILILILLAVSPSAFAASSGGSSGGGGGGDFQQRAERRQSQRWTLQEWLAQKDRNRMMDMWLSMNSPSPYELMLGVSYNSYEQEATGASANKYTSYQGTFSAYAQFVGLTAEYENNTQEDYNDLTGIFNLRLAGSSIQGSYLALHYGMRTHTQASPQLALRQQFAQASLQLYVIKQFGFDGLYRSYMPTTDTTLGDVKGTLTEAGAFIDFQNFRIFGSWYKDVQNAQLNGTTTDTTRTGIRSGLKIFF